MVGRDQVDRTLARVRRYRDEGPLLERICASTRPLLGVDAAAINLMGSLPAAEVVAMAGQEAGRMVELQFDLGEGPAVEAFRQRQDVLVADLATREGERWPLFASAALALGTRAVFAHWVGVGHVGIGVLHLQRQEAGGLTTGQASEARGLAEVCTSLLLETDGAPTSRLHGQVRSRAVVHQATGMIAAQIGSTVEVAGARLRAHAFVEGSTVSDVAVEVVTRRVRFES